MTDDKKIILRNLTEDERVKLQDDNPDVIIFPMSEQQLEEGREALHQLQKEGDKFPILKRTEASLEFFSMQKDMNRARLEFIDKLEYMPIKAAIQNWLINLGEETRLKYAEYITDMMSRGIIHEFFADGKEFTVGGFRYIRHESVINYIKNMPDWSEGSRQAKAACYISFTSYLHRISYGWFIRAMPIDTGVNKTFTRLSPKTITQALSLENWHHFLDVLNDSNQRDSLIARCMLYGGHRVSEILNIKIDQIDFEKNIIRFTRGKNKNLELPFVYPAPFMEELKAYMQATEEQRAGSRFVFVTRNGKPLTRSRLNYSFAHSSAQIDIERVTPEILRATWIRFNQENVVDEKILKMKRYFFKPGPKGN
jgi:integrase/recombinase XerD